MVNLEDSNDSHTLGGTGKPNPGEGHTVRRKDDVGSQSILRFIRSTVALTRMFPTLELIWE